ncbi:formate dehydrogenase family accessory protein FdhD [Mycobacterium sp. Root135]|uniref:formate dehydrogenase accessory sulfurtransferase FdhD n=1 Tax=Mycobacterium sp. Root135 TaxID=1736457 RepID=UPI0006F36157|nr:formate dehydrogenase accessory sulfurtransferase FdhD [Mycobacterium sp. Root135]KQY04576.1 formate dehydrogenase family accessory protein FdhD [Mycobacterium sp. Root135]
MGRVTSRYRVLRLDDGVGAHRPDSLAAEEPLEIRVGGRPLTVTMRTPGDDFDLARGFLVSEGVVTSAEDVTAIRYCAGATVGGANTYNVVDVLLDDAVPAPDASLERNFYTTSSCGVCGKASLDAVRTVSRWSVDADPVRLSATTISTLPDTLRAAQRVFDRTGGLHAAGLFDADGTLSCVREDVGRHNAVDKVIGWAVGQGRLPLTGMTLMVSGRASFELVQKAVMAGVPALAAVSAPSSLAVDLAREMGLTLVGFLRGTTMNVYSGEQRFGAVVPGSDRPAVRSAG